jgi:hypothetical protein
MSYLYAKPIKDPEWFSGVFTIIFSTFLIMSAIFGVSYSITEMTKFTVPLWVFIISIILDVMTLFVGIAGYSSVYGPADSMARYISSIVYTFGLVALFFLQLSRLCLSLFATSLTIFSIDELRNNRMKLAQYIAFGIVTVLMVGCCVLGISTACFQLTSQRKYHEPVAEAYSSVA